MVISLEQWRRNQRPPGPWNSAAEVFEEQEYPLPNPIEKLNRATEEQLLEIKGVGSKTAEKILENGPYESLEQTTEKTGLKPKVFDAIALWIKPAHHP